MKTTKTYTASFHNGGRKKSKNGNDVKNPWQACREHNIRDPKYVKKQKHIKQNGVEGIDYEIWKDTSWEAAYKEIFSEAIEKYNAKQKRSDRKIKDSNEYLEKIKNHKTKVPVYESIVTIGNAKNLPENKELVKRIYREFVKYWETHYPKLRIIGVYYHADESREKGIKYDNKGERIIGAPHIHIDWIPIETDRQESFDEGKRIDENGKKTKYLRGMDVENSLTGAFAQMNIFAQSLSPKAAAKKGLHRNEVKFKDAEKQKEYESFLESRDTDTREYYAVMFWENQQREVLKKICKKHGITIENPNEHREHLDTDEYTQEQSALETMEYTQQLAMDLENEKAMQKKNNDELEETRSEYEKGIRQNQQREQELLQIEYDQDERHKEIESEVKKNNELLDLIKSENEKLSKLQNDTNLQIEKAREQVEKETLDKLDSATKANDEANAKKENANEILKDAEKKNAEAQAKLDNANSYLEEERKKIQTEEKNKMNELLDGEKAILTDSMKNELEEKERNLEQSYTEKWNTAQTYINEKNTKQDERQKELDEREKKIKNREENFIDNVWKKFERIAIPNAEGSEFELPKPSATTTALQMYNSAKLVFAKLRKYFSEKIDSLKTTISQLKEKVNTMQKDSDELKELKKPFHKEWQMKDGSTLKLNLPFGGKEALNAMAEIIYGWETDTPEHNLEKTRQHQLKRQRNKQYEHIR